MKSNRLSGEYNGFDIPEFSPKKYSAVNKEEKTKVAAANRIRRIL
jgi:hypothetical protein